MPSLKPISSFYLLMCSSSSGRKTGLPDKFLFAIHSLRILNECKIADVLST